MADFTLIIPLLGQEGQVKELTLSSGQHVFILGPNGSGKSSLMQRFYTNHQKHCVRLSAHRQTWFTSDSLDLSPQSKRQSEKNIKHTDARVEARWKDDMAAARANIAVYELIDAENVRARRIAAAVDGNDMDGARALASDEAPIAIINELMKLAGLPITLAIHENERILAQRHDSEPYSIAELSDGERNALLLAAAVLTAPKDSLILVDEPERHLHRSIISPLLTHLFARRNDCVFVVSTHEVLLPMDHPEASTILVRACNYASKNPSGWELDILPHDADIPEDMKRDILGARSKILFIEGTEDSLDKPLYGILFPQISVVPKGSCVEVERATLGVRSSDGHHWTEAYGLVDGDGRSADELQELTKNGVGAAPCYSVESLYYDPSVLKAVAERVTTLDGSDADDRLDKASSAMLRALSKHKVRLCERVANRRIRECVLRQIPSLEQAQGGATARIEVPLGDFVAEEEDRFSEALDRGDVAALIRRYPVRETPALTLAARELGFQTRRDYEAAVLRACNDSGEVRATILALLGTLPDLLNQVEKAAVEQVASAERPAAVR